MKHGGRGAFAGANRLLDIGVRNRAVLTWRLFRDERVSGLKFAAPALLLLYLVSPLDFIPDVLLGIGQADDVGIGIGAVILLLRIIPGLAPADVVEEHLRAMGQDTQTTESPRPASVIDARYSVR